MAKKEDEKKSALPVKPIGDNILVELTTTRKTETGLILPDVKIIKGTIRAIGKAVPTNMLREKDDENGFAVGDDILLSRVNKDSIIPSKDGETGYIVIPSCHVTAVSL